MLQANSWHGNCKLENVGMDLACADTSSASVACILHVDSDSRFWIQGNGFKILDSNFWIVAVKEEGRGGQIAKP